MSRLEQIKNEVARLKSFNNYSDVLINGCNTQINEISNEAAKIYAKECSQASLEKASRIAKTFKNGNSGSYRDASIDKESITQESNIVLL